MKNLGGHQVLLLPPGGGVERLDVDGEVDVRLGGVCHEVVAGRPVQVLRSLARTCGVHQVGRMRRALASVAEGVEHGGVWVDAKSIERVKE